MAGKSRHGKGKRYHYSKKSKALHRQAIAGAPAAAMNAAPAAPTAMAAPSKAAAAQATENPYPYVGGELRRIAILGGIIIVILVVLSFVLT
jgi:hypothetical protein